MIKVGLRLQIKFNFILLFICITTVNLLLPNPVCDFFKQKDINVWISMVMIMIYTNKLYNAYYMPAGLRSLYPLTFNSHNNPMKHIKQVLSSNNVVLFNVVSLSC